ncbi:MAG TPA: DUF4494 domain-containing protein [Prolixibacteraceae bacterium]|nr:DUF4494 domain-containing protein [Prolixibacteraceae bacterium]HUM88407.1 DUF4494 domain-containing protein [Prolixibacteraceae bacterium]
MQTWYECKVKYMKLDQSGMEQNVNDNYLIDAVSFTDAETRIFEIMKEITRGDFQVVNIRKSNITEVVSKNDGEWWYKAKINLVTIDEEKGKERKITNYILVMANDIHDALKQLDEGLSYMLVPYATTAIQLSTIADVFPYIPGEHVKPEPQYTQAVKPSMPEPEEIEEEFEETEEVWPGEDDEEDQNEDIDSEEDTEE